MKIIDVRWRSYRLPLLNSFTTAHGVMTAREGIIIQITTERGISGIGEIAPLPASGWSSPANSAASRSLLPDLAARLQEKTLAEALELLHAGSKTGGIGADLSSPAPGAINVAATPLRIPEYFLNPHYRPTFTPTLCGLEIALLDALGKTEGCGVSMLLSPVGTVPRAKVPVNAVIGASTTEAAIEAAREAMSNGFLCVKLKAGLGGSVREEIERVAAVRDAIGPAMHLRLDANEAWNLEQAIAILSQCVPYDIQYVEQPLKAHDLAGMRDLRRAVPIPIAVDEALHGLESAQLVLDNEAADILVIKPQLAGGLHAVQQIIQAAAERGVRSVITSAIETGIGVAAALHLAAASPAVTLECGLATLHLLVDDLLVEGLPVRDGFLRVPAGPGLGVMLDKEALDRYSLRGLD